MKHIRITLAVAVSLTAAGIANADQHQQFGRDSFFAVPGTTTRSSPDTATAPINRFGRDSVYVTQRPNVASAPVSADAKGAQEFGRDSVYARGAPNSPTAPGSETTVGSTERNHGG
jgi:hypothetical protein